MTAAAAYDMEQHRWQHRVLVLVAPETGDAMLQAQIETVARRRDAVLDRDLRVVRLAGDRGSVDGRPLTADETARLRRRLDLAKDQRALLLIGKDGGVKRRAPLDLDLREVFVQIDAMPMRRAEMRAKRAAGETVTAP